MGTNYYLIENVCEHCGRGEREVHIGKKSAGWEFSFHGYKPPVFIGEDIVTSWEMWKRKIKHVRNRVRDEYGQTISDADFVTLVEESKGGQNHTRYCRIHHPEHAARSCELDDAGYSFNYDDFS